MATRFGSESSLARLVLAQGVEHAVEGIGLADVELEGVVRRAGGRPKTPAAAPAAVLNSPLTPDITRLPLLLTLAQSNPMFRNFVRETSIDLDVQDALLHAADGHVVDHVRGKYLAATATIFGTASC